MGENGNLKQVIILRYEYISIYERKLSQLSKSKKCGLTSWKAMRGEERWHRQATRKGTARKGKRISLTASPLVLFEAHPSWLRDVIRPGNSRLVQVSCEALWSLSYVRTCSLYRGCRTQKVIKTQVWVAGALEARKWQQGGHLMFVMWVRFFIYWEESNTCPESVCP